MLKIKVITFYLSFFKVASKKSTKYISCFKKYLENKKPRANTTFKSDYF